MHVCARVRMCVGMRPPSCNVAHITAVGCAAFSPQAPRRPRSKEDLRGWFQLFSMSVPAAAPQPLLKFAEVDFGARVNAHLRANFDQPMPVQAQVQTACQLGGRGFPEAPDWVSM